MLNTSLLLATETFGASSHSGPNLKPWEQYGQIGKYYNSCLCEFQSMADSDSLLIRA